MGFDGKPSAGCTTCRLAKKKCDRRAPLCSRCARLGADCGGYRDPETLIFRDETDKVANGLKPKRRKGPEQELRVTKGLDTCAEKDFFFEHFLGPTYLSYLRRAKLDGLLAQSMIACATHVLAFKNSVNSSGLELARSRYVDAIHQTRSALQSPRSAQRDSTLLTILLLAMFERLAWDPTVRKNWSEHTRGLTLVLQLRGAEQLKTKSGAALYRDTVLDLIANSLFVETAISPVIVKLLPLSNSNDEANRSLDQLMLIAARIADMRQSFRLGNQTDKQLLHTADELQHDLHSWGEESLCSSSFSFRILPDWTGDHAFEGLRHGYHSEHVVRYWNLWRVLNILLSRQEEELWRRSWPSLSGAQSSAIKWDRFLSTRLAMARDICIAASSVIGNGESSSLIPSSSVYLGQILMQPLSAAGTCFIECLSDIGTTANGARFISLDQQYHLDSNNQASRQLSWIIDRLDYIGAKIGIKAACNFSNWLRGNDGQKYDLARSRVIHEEDIVPVDCEPIFDMD